MILIYNRKSIRIKDYDYSNEGFYYVTICTNNRKNFLSEIINLYNKEVKIELTSLGKIVDNAIKFINLKNENVKIVEYVIMPNHIHMIINIQGGYGTPPLQQIICNFKSYTNKKYNDILGLKYEKMWQRNYYEHIIRNEKEYYKICKYIYENPIKNECDF